MSDDPIGTAYTKGYALGSQHASEMLLLIFANACAHVGIPDEQFAQLRAYIDRAIHDLKPPRSHRRKGS